MAEGINIPEKKPTPPDSIFSKAIGGWYDIVVAMYHDQGHIPLKVKGFVYNKELKKKKLENELNQEIDPLKQAKIIEKIMEIRSEKK